MKFENLLSKPIILSLLFMLFLFIFSLCLNSVFILFNVNFGFIIYPLIWALVAFFVGVLYTKTNKKLLSKNQKIKTVSYTLSVLLLLFLLLMSFMLDLFWASPIRLIASFLFLILPTFMIILSAICAYPALSLGSRIAKTDKLPNNSKSNLYDLLIIIFCLILGVFAVKFNNPALNSIKPFVIKYYENKGYIRKTPKLGNKQTPFNK